jgi:hypothetical protein
MRDLVASELKALLCCSDDTRDARVTEGLAVVCSQLRLQRKTTRFYTGAIAIYISQHKYGAEIPVVWLDGLTYTTTALSCKPEDLFAVMFTCTTVSGCVFATCAHVMQWRGVHDMDVRFKCTCRIHRRSCPSLI